MRNDPRMIKARFKCKCAETGKPINKGDQCIYYPIGKKVYHMESKQAAEYRAWQADISMGFDY